MNSIRFYVGLCFFFAGLMIVAFNKTALEINGGTTMFCTGVILIFGGNDKSNKP